MRSHKAASEVAPKYRYIIEQLKHTYWIKF